MEPSHNNIKYYTKLSGVAQLLAADHQNIVIVLQVMALCFICMYIPIYVCVHVNISLYICCFFV